MIVAGVGNTCGSTNTQYSNSKDTSRSVLGNSNNRRDGEPAQADKFDHTHARQERPSPLEVEAEVVVQSTIIVTVLGPSPARLVMPRVLVCEQKMTYVDTIP